jgi:hypothetical protein
VSVTIVVVVFALLTVWLSVPVEKLKFESPLYVAENVTAPVVPGVSWHEAVPPESVRKHVVGPADCDTCTVPVGVPAPGEAAATVIFSVTACPNTLGSGLDVIVTVLFALLTWWPTPALTEPL